MITDAPCQSSKLVSKRALLQEKPFWIRIVRRQAIEQSGKLKQLVAPGYVTDLGASFGLKVPHDTCAPASEMIPRRSYANPRRFCAGSDQSLRRNPPFDHRTSRNRD
jgi:hypothetical protein